MYVYDYTNVSKSVRITFTVNADMNCTVKNVMYVIECRGCEKYYIGETNNRRKRTTLHHQHIRHEKLRMIPLSGHLASCSDNDQNILCSHFTRWALTAY